MTGIYDRSGTGWDSVGSGPAQPRPEDQRQRCGDYIAPDGERSWGDHRVTFPGSTCEQTNCDVNHHPTLLPGWAEPMAGFYDRPGARAIAAAFYGWDAAGYLPRPLGDTTAWVASHVALDALRDAGYDIVPRDANREC